MLRAGQQDNPRCNGTLTLTVISVDQMPPLLAACRYAWWLYNVVADIVPDRTWFRDCPPENSVSSSSSSSHSPFCTAVTKPCGDALRNLFPCCKATNCSNKDNWLSLLPCSRVRPRLLWKKNGKTLQPGASSCKQYATRGMAVCCVTVSSPSQQHGKPGSILAVLSHVNDKRLFDAGRTDICVAEQHDESGKRHETALGA